MTRAFVHRGHELEILACCHYGMWTEGIAWVHGALAHPQFVKVAHGHGLTVATYLTGFGAAATGVV